MLIKKQAITSFFFDELNEAALKEK